MKKNKKNQKKTDKKVKKIFQPKKLNYLPLGNMSNNRCGWIQTIYNAFEPDNHIFFEGTQIKKHGKICCLVDKMVFFGQWNDGVMIAIIEKLSNGKYQWTLDDKEGIVDTWDEALDKMPAKVIYPDYSVEHSEWGFIDNESSIPAKVPSKPKASKYKLSSFEEWNEGSLEAAIKELPEGNYEWLVGNKKGIVPTWEDAWNQMPTHIKEPNE
jgi:hypothetical protein